MKIGEVSARSGASIRSLHYYEEVGLIAADRTPGGQRWYDVEVVERVQVIRQLLAVGLGTTAIADVLPCLSDPSRQTTKLTHRLIAERDRLIDEIEQRERMRMALDEIIAAAPTVD